MEWNGTIRNSEITKYTFSLIAVVHYKRLYCIMLQIVNIVLGVKQYIEILLYCNIHYCNTNREYRYIAYCNILQYIARYCSRLKNKMTNKCVKAIISVSDSLLLSA